VHWKSYEIATPTFSLTPVEKPDMSPYLVHMTGKNEIAAILAGKGSKDAAEARQGFLRAGIPEQSRGNYHAKVVCFTESPTFAVDFFRYRVFRRWERNMLFGIGFSKSDLVAKGVLPALYLSETDTRRLVGLHDALSKKTKSYKEGSVSARMKEFFEPLYPLCTPLLEQHPTQGFLWEREWRYPHEPGFAFDHADVRVICCPDDEREDITEQLGENAEDVRFVRTWAEFSDVTDYLERQERKWAMAPKEQAKVKAIKIAVALLKTKTIALHTLDGYLEKLERTQEEMGKASELRAALKKEIAMLAKKIAELKEAAK
jgi:hypothetical protein